MFGLKFNSQTIYLTSELFLLESISLTQKRNGTNTSSISCISLRGREREKRRTALFHCSTIQAPMTSGRAGAEPGARSTSRLWPGEQVLVSVPSPRAAFKVCARRKLELRATHSHRTDTPVWSTRTSPRGWHSASTFLMTKV